MERLKGKIVNMKYGRYATIDVYLENNEMIKIRESLTNSLVTDLGCSFNYNVDDAYDLYTSLVGEDVIIEKEKIIDGFSKNRYRYNLIYKGRSFPFTDEDIYLPNYK